MAQSKDHYMISLKATNIVTFSQPALAQRVVDDGGSGIVLTNAWAQDPVGITITILNIGFTTPKNSLTEAQVLTLANDLATISSRAIYTISKSDAITLP
jgi:hypothetical protein